MAAGGKNRVSQVLVLLVFVSGLAAAYYLFFVSAFPGYQGIIFPDSQPPPPVTGWHKFAFWPPIPGTTADPFVTFLFVAPVAVSVLGLMTIWVKHHSAKAWILWSLFLILDIAIAPRIVDFGFYYLPAAAFLLAAAINET